MTRDPQTGTLLAQWHRGDEAALGELMRRDLPWLRREVRRRIGNELLARAEPDDIVQHVMIEVLKHGPRFLTDDRDHYRALLLRLVENAIRKQIRDGRRQKRDVRREQPLPSGSVLALDGRGPRPSSIVDRNERRAWIHLALELLDARDREVILLRQWEGRTFAAIGECSGTSEDGARMRFERAVGRLARLVKRLRAGEIERVLG